LYLLDLTQSLAPFLKIAQGLLSIFYITQSLLSSYGVRSAKFIFAPCAQLYSLAENPQHPPRGHIRGGYWSSKTDDICLGKLGPPDFTSPSHSFKVSRRLFTIHTYCLNNMLFLYLTKILLSILLFTSSYLKSSFHLNEVLLQPISNAFYKFFVIFQIAASLLPFFYNELYSVPCTVPLYLSSSTLSLTVLSWQYTSFNLSTHLFTSLHLALVLSLSSKIPFDLLCVSSQFAVCQVRSRQ
jgi:hypothetical protein